MDKITIITICSILILVVLVIINKESILSFFMPSKPIEEPKPQPVAPPAPVHRPAIVLFYADWCPHCQHFKPEWEKLSNVLKNSPFDTIDFEQKRDPAEIERNQVTGFPTIRIYPDGYPSDNFQVYKGERTADAILQYLSSGNEV